MVGDSWDFLAFSKTHKRLGQDAVALWQRAEPLAAGGTLEVLAPSMGSWGRGKKWPRSLKCSIGAGLVLAELRHLEGNSPSWET